MCIYSQASSARRKSSLYKIGELKLKRASRQIQGLSLRWGAGGRGVCEEAIQNGHSDPALWVAKSRKAVADGFPTSSIC